MFRSIETHQMHGLTEKQREAKEEIIICPPNQQCSLDGARFVSLITNNKLLF